MFDAAVFIRLSSREIASNLAITRIVIEVTRYLATALSYLSLSFSLSLDTASSTVS